VLVRPDDGGIQIVLRPIELAANIRLLLKRLKDALPDTGSSPTVEACGRYGRARNQDMLIVVFRATQENGS
jgi:hypothetical protein